jgi:hypothetical protein
VRGLKRGRGGEGMMCHRESNIDTHRNNKSRAETEGRVWCVSSPRLPRIHGTSVFSPCCWRPPSGSALAASPSCHRGA